MPGSPSRSPSRKEFRIVKSRQNIFGMAVIGLIGAIIGSFSMMLYASTHFANVAGPGDVREVRARVEHHREAPDDRADQADDGHPEDVLTRLHDPELLARG